MAAAIFDVADDGTLEIFTLKVGVEKIPRVIVTRPDIKTSKVFTPKSKGERPESQPPLTYTYNEKIGYRADGDFICHKCGVHVKDWKRLKTDNDGQERHYKYTLKHCPECGAKIIAETTCEFCRWHSSDGICIRPRDKKRRTPQEDTCFWWDERRDED